MTLDSYLKSPGAKRLTELAAKVGISKGRLSQLRDRTDWPPSIALDIETATDGVLDAALLSPVVARARADAA